MNSKWIHPQTILSQETKINFQKVKMKRGICLSLRCVSCRNHWSAKNKNTLKRETLLVTDGKSKSEEPQVFIEVIKANERTFETKTKMIRTNNGTKFLNQTFTNCIIKLGSKHETSSQYIHEEKWWAVNANSCVLEPSRANRLATKLSATWSLQVRHLSEKSSLRNVHTETIQRNPLLLILTEEKKKRCSFFFVDDLLFSLKTFQFLRKV